MNLDFDNLDLPSVLSSAIPLIVFITLKNKTFSLQLKVLLFYLLVSFFTDVVCLLHLQKINTNYLVNGFTYVEFMAILFIYERQWNKQKLRLPFLVIALVFSFYFALNFFTDALNNFYVYINTFEALTIIVLSIFYFFTLVNNLHLPKLTQFYFFWFNTAFLVYFSAVLFVFLFMNYILDPNASQSVKNLWLIHNTFHIIYNCTLAIGLLKWKKTTV